MPRQSVPFYRLGGEVSAAALARVDLEKMRLSASYRVNVQPLASGASTLRPGTAYLGSTYNDSAAKLIEFVYATDDTALIELTDSKMRVWRNDALISRVSVSTAIAALASWTKTESANSTVTLASPLTIASVSKGQVSYADTSSAVSAGDQAKEHAVRIVVGTGVITLKVGTSSGGDDLISATLGEGTHSLSFTPNAGTIYFRIESNLYRAVSITSVAIEAAGNLEIATPWTSSDLVNVQYDQSADVVYVACDGVVQKKIERRSATSWSLVDYEPEDGPFPSDAGSSDIILTPSVYIGNGTLTSDRALFKSTDVGALVRLFHNGQTVEEPLNKINTFSEAIRVAGANRTPSVGGGNAVGISDRQFYITISGTWVGTIEVQSSVDGPDSGFIPYRSYTSNTTNDALSDGVANTVIWYRIGFTSYTSGTATVKLRYSGGGGAGIVRITGYTSSTQVSMEVLSHCLGTTAADNWRFGEWGERNGYPSAVALHEGRLWWAGQSKIWGSESDDYEAFDFDKTGDAATIARSIGKGPIANIRWLTSLSRLVIGTDMGAVTARSNSIDEPLTPTVFNLKYSVTQGATNIRPVIVDSKAFYVQRSGRRIYGMVFSSQDFDYRALDMTRLNIDVGAPGFVDMAVQRQLDTHIRLPLGDGLMACLLYDEDDEIDEWWRVETDGDIENVVVLPGSLEDSAYVIVKRTINGATKRYLEKFARLDECVGGSTSKLADSHIVYSGASTTTITGLDHLEGKAVVVWAAGAEMGFSSSDPTTIATYTVTGGSITVPTAVTSAIIGLPYTGKFISTKLAYAAGGGTALNRVKRVNNIGMILKDTHYQGIRFGHWHGDPSESVLRSLPLIERGKATASGTVWSAYDQQTIPFPGQWDADSRFQIEMRAPRPATVLGVTIDVTAQG